MDTDDSRSQYVSVGIFADEMIKFCNCPISRSQSQTNLNFNKKKSKRKTRWRYLSNVIMERRLRARATLEKERIGERANRERNQVVKLRWRSTCQFIFLSDDIAHI